MCSAEPHSEAASCCLCLSKFATCCSKVATCNSSLKLGSLLTSQASFVGTLYSKQCPSMHVVVGCSCLLTCHAVIAHDAAIAGIGLCWTARYTLLPGYAMGRDALRSSWQKPSFTALKQHTSRTAMLVTGSCEMKHHKSAASWIAT